MAECQTIDVSEICGVASSQLSEPLDDELEASVWGRLYPLHDSYSKVGNVLVCHHMVTQDTWVHGYIGYMGTWVHRIHRYMGTQVHRIHRYMGTWLHRYTGYIGTWLHGYTGLRNITKLVRLHRTTGVD